MECKFVVRLLNDEGALIAWTTVMAYPKPQDTRASCPFWPVSLPTQLTTMRGGVISEITIHWTDLDIARTHAVDPFEVKAGQLINFGWMEPVWLVGGMQDVKLPPVTVGLPVTIGVPSGSLNSVGTGF